MRRRGGGGEVEGRGEERVIEGEEGGRVGGWNGLLPIKLYSKRRP